MMPWDFFLYMSHFLILLEAAVDYLHVDWRAASTHQTDAVHAYVVGHTYLIA